MTRVLFIDDEPLVLRALDRALRARRVSWDVRFAESGEGALQLLSRESFDVVVADLRIPDRDGVEVLTEVQRAYPRIARLVLSGQVGTDDCLRAMRVAHQCLAKPCKIDRLCEVVRRVVWSYRLLDDEALATAAARMSCLSTPPRVHLDVCAAIGRGAGLAQIAAIIDDDIALTAKLIQIVNSAFFTHGTQVNTVQQALTVLGTDVVRGLLLGSEVFRAADCQHVTDARHRHSRLVAQIARTLAPVDLAGEAFVAGMLHDIGDLVLIDVGRQPLRIVEHARAGGFLLGLWGIASPIVEAIAYHHEPGVIADESARLVDLLHVAEIVAGELETSHDAEVISAEWLVRHSPAELEHARAVAREIWGQSA